MQDSPSSRGSKPSAKNPCPLCGEPKTPWSAKCQTCEGNRQLFIAAVEHQESDQQLLARLRVVRQATIAREMNVSRQRIGQIVRDATKRQNFLQQHQQTTAA